MGTRASSAGTGLRRRLLRLLRLIVVTYVAVCVALWVGQRHVQYAPDDLQPPRPNSASYAALEDVTLEASDGVMLRAWYWPGEVAVTIVIFHGNAGNRGHRLPWAARLHDRGFGVFLLDYRGFGGSEGSPTEEGLYRDGEAAIRWLRARSSDALVFLGESLGSGVAVEIARRHPPDALIVQGGFSSAVAVGASIYPWIPVGWLLEDRYESDEKIGEVRCPKLHIHGERDGIVAPELGRALYARAPEPKELWIVEGAGHNDLLTVAGEAYYDRVESFIQQNVEPPPR